MIQDRLREMIAGALTDLGVEVPVISLEQPADMSHGDYSTNVAMVVAKKVGKNPKQLAEDIVTLISARQDLAEQGVAHVEVAGAGFINFTLANNFFAELSERVRAERHVWGKASVHNGKKILVEHSSPNLFKPFHIGHMMNNAIGESLVRLMQFSGATVATMSFPSDISLGIAKAIFILLEDHGADFTPTNIAVLGDAYVTGTRRYDEDEAIHPRVREIADNLYAQIASPELAVFEKCKHFNISYFESIALRLGSHFDTYIYESEAGVAGKDIVTENTPKIFTESEGAVVYIPEETKKYLNTAVFINSQGNPTYEAKDLGLLSLKFSQEHPDLSIFVTDYQQVPHFQVVLDAAEKIEKSWVEKSVHIPHGRMSFKGQKMSSRLGGVPLITDIIDTVVAELRERTPDMSAELADAVAISAVKFSILRAKPGQNINFDPETSLSFEGDSGPYLQYTHARMMSLLEKGANAGIIPAYDNAIAPSEVERIIVHFGETVERAITDYAPQAIIVYLLELARAFNSYYASHQIIDESDSATSTHRLAVVAMTQTTLHNGLGLLGIEAVEKM